MTSAEGLVFAGNTNLEVALLWRPVGTDYFRRPDLGTGSNIRSLSDRDAATFRVARNIDNGF